MKTINYEVINQPNKVSIKGHWIAPALDFECEIYETGSDNADAQFILNIEARDQVFKGEISMKGNWEREAFKETLELILKYL